MNIENLIKVNDEKTKSKLLDYIGEDFKKVPYLYLDLEKYGLGNDNVETWYYNYNDDVKCIFLRYFNCLHIYTKNLNDNIENLIDNVINNLKPHTIITIDKVGLYLENKLFDKYKMIINKVLDGTNVLPNGIYYKVEEACRNDLSEVANLFLKSEHFQTIYTKDILLKQLESRYDSKFGRTFIVRDNEKIVGSISTYGENKKFAILSGFIIDETFKKPGLAVSLAKWVSKVLGEEGKRSISINSFDNERSINFALKMGNVILADIYEFIKL